MDCRDFLQLVAGFWRRTNLAVCRLGPEIYRDAT
jgi:hypothetical protein